MGSMPDAFMKIVARREPSSTVETDAEVADAVRADGHAAVLALLEPNERLIATVVAIADDQLDITALAEIAECTVASVADALAILDGVGLVRETPDGRLIAAHALVREALLDGSSRTVRRELHERVARTLDARGISAAVVAPHIEASGSAALARRGIELALIAARSSLELGDMEGLRAALTRAVRLAASVDGGA